MKATSDRTGKGEGGHGNRNADDWAAHWVYLEITARQEMASGYEQGQRSERTVHRDSRCI